jgi:Fe-S cluster biosynthesis and repair protein YggX
MTDTTCARCHANEPGIESMIPFRSPLREEVRSSICSDCWKQWLEMQIKVINEFALNLGDVRSHEIIEAHARDFLGLGDGSTGTDFDKIGEAPPGGHPAH